jgi:hypothetical protein
MNLRINGVKQGEDSGSLGIAAPSLFRLGQGSNCKQKVYDLIVFGTLQHSSDYSPNWSNIFETVYLETEATLPEMEHAGPGEIQEVNSMSITEGDSPRYLIQIGRSGTWLYWNGSEWVESNGTYAQASTAAQFIANCTDLDVEGEIYGQFKVLFPAGNTQGYVDTLNINIRETLGYTAGGENIAPSDRYQSSNIVSIGEKATKPANTEIKYIFEVDGYLKYWNGSDWVESDGTYAQANTASEANAEILSLIDEASYVRLFILLYTSDGESTPTLDESYFYYEYPAGLKSNLNAILAFIGTTSLTDTEYSVIEAALGSEYEDSDVYDALYAIISTREGASDVLNRLIYYYYAKNVSIGRPEPESNVYIGGVL